MHVKTTEISSLINQIEKKSPKFDNVNFARLYENGHFHILHVQTRNGIIL